MFVHPSEAHSRVNTGKINHIFCIRIQYLAAELFFYQADKGADGKDLMSVVERKDLSLL